MTQTDQPIIRTVGDQFNKSIHDGVFIVARWDILNFQHCVHVNVFGLKLDEVLYK